MDLQERMTALLTASPGTLRRIDEILEGRDRQPEKAGHTKLMTIAEGRRFLGWSYSKIRRAIDDGLLDVVGVTGSRLIREESLYELANGRRQLSAEALARRVARNAARREEYRLQRARSADRR